MGHRVGTVSWAGIVCLVGFCSFLRAQTSAAVTITITGTVISGTDGNPDSNPPGKGKIFGGGSDLSGQPFTLTIQISGSEGTSNSPGTCSDGTIYSSAITGSNPSTPPTARLQIGTSGGSFTYGALSLSSIGWAMVRTAQTSCSSYNSVTLGWSEYEQSSAGDYSGGSGFGSVVLYTQNDLSPGPWYTPIPMQGATSSALQFRIGITQATNIYNDLYFASGYLNPTAISVAGPEWANSQTKISGAQCTCSCPCAGNPITVATGNKFEQVVDYETVGTNKLGFARYYNSLSPPDALATTLGGNWRSTYDRYIGIVSPTSVFAERADGRVFVFALNGTNWISDSDVDVKLTQSGSTWTLTDTDDTVETYTAGSGNVAYLNSIQARNGYMQTLQYNANNQLASITDSYGRSLQLAYQSGLLHSVTTPDGLVLAYGYAATASGAQSQLVSVTYSTSPQTSQTYLYENAALPFALTGITDEDGNRYATWTYDAQGRGLSSQHAGGADLTTVAYDDTTGNRTVTNALGPQQVYKFTTLQGVPKVTEIDRQGTSTTTAASQTFTYDTNGYTASVTDWNGNQTTYVNDVHGQPTTISEAVGTPQARTTSITYLSNYHLPSQIVTPGLTTNYSYDGSGNLLTKTLNDTTTTTTPYATNGQTRTWTYTWSNFLLASAKGPRTDVSELTAFAYDSSGALTSIANALGQTTKVTQHLPGGLPQAIVDPNGVTTTLTYDARQRLLSSTISTVAGPLATQYSYDAAGNLVTFTLPDGSSLTNAYDAAHRLTGTTDLLSSSIAYTLDAAGDRTAAAITNSGGTTTRQHSAMYDALGRLLSDIGGVGQTTVYAYDSNGNPLSIIVPLNHVTQQVFDPLNRRTRITDPAQGVTTFSYL
jgi:YD repeat-containing protein